MSSILAGRRRAPHCRALNRPPMRFGALPGDPAASGKLWSFNMITTTRAQTGLIIPSKHDRLDGPDKQGYGGKPAPPCTLHVSGSGLIGRLAGRVGLPGATFCPLCHEYLGGDACPGGLAAMQVQWGVAPGAPVQGLIGIAVARVKFGR